MKTIQTTVVVDAEHRATIQLPPDVAPGEHAVTLILAESEPSRAPTPEDFPTHDIPWAWPEDYTFRREDLYGDEGR